MDQNNDGRHFVVGDIHGMYDLLLDKLKEVGFDRSRDCLHALGDLVDRGLENERVVALLDEPWFDSIKGNHEDLLISAFHGDEDGHNQNGGRWYDFLSWEKREQIAHRLDALPLFRTVVTPSGGRYGLAHADILGTDWDAFVAAMEAPSPALESHVMWNRVRCNDVKRGAPQAKITGVDHVYFGHNILPFPITRGNQSWIDTGAYASGRLTMLELL